MSHEHEGVSFIPDDTPYLDIRPKKYDVTINLYGVPGRLFGTLRQVIMNLVPANIDISLTSEEVGTDYLSQFQSQMDTDVKGSFEDSLMGLWLPDGYELGPEAIAAIGTQLLKKGII